MAKEGDKVKVVTKDETVEGILMPNKETDSVVIKLDSGYNVGFDKKKVKKIEVIGKAKKAAEKKRWGNESEQKIAYYFNTAYWRDNCLQG